MQKYMDMKNSECSTQSLLQLLYFLAKYYSFLWKKKMKRRFWINYLYQGFTNKLITLPPTIYKYKEKEEPFKQCSVFSFRQRYSAFTDEKCS